MKPGGGPARIESIDALRGLALLGILQVNIQSFAWGAGDPLGYLGPRPNNGELVLYFFQASLLEGKIYPIFAFLFGVGLSLQARRMSALHAGPAPAILRRRMLVLLGIGAAHGLLLYFGDVLMAYALCALVLIGSVRARLRNLIALSRLLWLGAAASLFLPSFLSALLGWNANPEQIPASLQAAHEIYCRGSFAAQLEQRWIDDLWQQLGGIVSFWPQVFALMTLGMVAGRLGWMQYPERYGRIWRRAWKIGFYAGLPLSLLGAGLTVVRAQNLPGAQGGWDEIVLGAGSLLSLAYVAVAVRALAQPWCAPARRWLACAGRVSLSNYVGQSLVMGIVLSGWGLGLAGTATRGELALLALLIFAVQMASSRLLLQRFRQGPLEALWRRCTYG